MSRRQYLELEKSPTIEVIKMLINLEAYYQGSRVVLCESRKKADQAVGVLRDNNIGVARRARPLAKRWGATKAFVVASGFYKPRRWAPWQ